MTNDALVLERKIMSFRDEGAGNIDVTVGGRITADTVLSVDVAKKRGH